MRTALREKTPSKYHNRKTTYKGIQFDSQKEENRYRELELLERAGLIRSIELQPRYDLIVNGHKCGFYKADFRYLEVETGQTIVEDCKSPPNKQGKQVTKTAVYQLKKKLVKALYDIEVIEV